MEFGRLGTLHRRQEAKQLSLSHLKNIDQLSQPDSGSLDRIMNSKQTLMSRHQDQASKKSSITSSQEMNKLK